MSLKSIVAPAELKEVLSSQSEKIIVLHFWEDWAEQCKHVNDALSELEKNEEIQETAAIYTVAAESLPEVSLQYQIKAVPTVVLIHKSKEIDRVEGANIKDIINRIKARASNKITQNEPNNLVENIDDRLRKLINMGPCVLFMKGSPKEPKCGFSKQIIAILDKHKADYMTFDILQDEEVRQELKRFSNWPTYPQLYLKGELIGGLDIVKEMDAASELESQLPKKTSLDDRLKMLINQHPVMVFMKGDPSNPRCGFSRTLVDMFKELSVKYGTFDILQDEEVRQGLKTYSNWPTYPQVYVKGDLIGGLDILKEMKEAGELKSVLGS